MVEERGRAPILEFDPDREAMIEPTSIIACGDVPEHCVLCFFGEVVAKVAEERGAAVASIDHWENGDHVLYEIEQGGRRLGFIHPGVGGPLAAGTLEDMIAHGCRKFVACGGCGVLESGMAVGHLIVVSAAVRDEGVSYHYLPASREIPAQAGGIAALEGVLRRAGLPYGLGKSWTTDAPYRETREKVAARRAEGCVAVEMEAASMMAVAGFRKVAFAQLLYGGDDLSGTEWNDRGWVSQPEIRERLFWLAADACFAL